MQPAALQDGSSAAILGGDDEVGRCSLTPPDPQLKGAWYSAGFNPCTYQVKNRFQSLPFKMQLAPLTVRFLVEGVRHHEQQRHLGGLRRHLRGRGCTS
jgi:hypothetical protein